MPVIVAGPWARPSIYPDIEGILKDPVAAYQQLNRLGTGLVSLPGAATGGVDVVSGLIKKGTQDPLGNIGQLLGVQPVDQAAPSVSIDRQSVTEENPAPAKKGKSFCS